MPNCNSPPAYRPGIGPILLRQTKALEGDLDPRLRELAGRGMQTRIVALLAEIARPDEGISALAREAFRGEEDEGGLHRATTCAQ